MPPMRPRPASPTIALPPAPSRAWPRRCRARRRRRPRGLRQLLVRRLDVPAGPLRRPRHPGQSASSTPRRRGSGRHAAPPDRRRRVPGPAASGAAGSPSAAPSSSPALIPGPSTSASRRRRRSSRTRTCPDSEFTCITLGVPRDHFSAGGPTWDVTFAIKRAAKDRKGVFVTITGGPGSAGWPAPTTTPRRSPSRSRTTTTSSSSTSAASACRSRSPARTRPRSTTRPTTTRPTRPSSTALPATPRPTWTRAWPRPKVDPADLPFYSTRQAVEDLEAFRHYLGVDKLALYGESYGTQYVQTYATAHPDHVASLFVDGPVDLTMDAPAFYREEVRAFDDALVATLTACDTDRVCRRDAAGRRARRRTTPCARSSSAGPDLGPLPDGEGHAS